MAKSIPSHAELVNYKSAVAGHDGTLSDVDGELFVKPCTAAEVAFYEDTRANHPRFAEHMPTYLGTLSLDQPADALVASIEQRAGHSIAPVAHAHSGPAATDTAEEARSTIPPAKTTKIDTDLAVVLENTAHGFVRPNILDVKLGVRLYADYARDEKKARFDKLSAETTHRDFGFRIGGMRVWQGEAARGQEEHVDDEGYRVYDKNYGRFKVHAGNVKAALRSFLFCERAGIDDELGRLVTQAFEVEITRILQVLEDEESRMYSASLLFVYEGDGAALRRAMEDASQDSQRHAAGASNGQSSAHPADPRESISEQVRDEGEATDDGDDSTDSEPEPRKIYSLKMIDFAHAAWTPGQGADDNQLLGLRSLAALFKDLAET